MPGTVDGDVVSRCQVLGRAGSVHHGHRRTGRHPFGGADRVLPEWIQWGGGGSSRNFPGSIFCGVAEFFPLTAVTDPKFVFSPVNCSNRP